MTKTLLLSTLIATTFVHADCSTLPSDAQLKKSLEAKDISQSQKLLVAYKGEIEKFLSTCGKSKENIEMTSVKVLTYEDTLKDLEHDNSKEKHTTDCSKTPDATALENAFKGGDKAVITKAYESYHKASESYLNDCASHAEYATVYESALFFEEEYNAL